MSKLTYKSYSWDKEFEIKGYFSDDKSKVVDHEANSGILTYSPNEIILEIFGEFSSDDEIITDFGHPIDKIYGFDSSGKLLILESYGSPFGTYNIPGFPMRKYRIKNFKIFTIDYNYLENDGNFEQLLSQLIDQLEDTQIQNYEFSFDHIEDWIGKSIVNTERDFEQQDFNINVNLSNYPVNQVVIESENLEFKDTVEYTFTYDNLTLSPHYKLILSPHGKGKVSFDKCYEVSMKVKDLVEILSDKPLSFVGIEFLCEKRKDNNYPIIKGKYFIQHSRSVTRWDKFRLHNISLMKMGKKFAIILNDWFNKKEKLEFIVSKFTANLHAKPYLEDQFMDSIRNLEVYARNFIVQPKNIISNEESENINRVINYINKNVDKEFKNRLRNRLKYKRKDSDLRKKLTYLFENISVELKQQYFSNQEISEVVNRLYDTRNYYTHGEERSNYKNLITDYHEMYDLLQLCQEVLRFYIFKEIGLEYSKEY